jgi:hypothetical protein
VRVTNDWIKNANKTRINLVEKAKVLEEVVINKYNLTGYLQIDSKLAPVQQRPFRYNIQGLDMATKAGIMLPVLSKDCRFCI